MVAVWRFWCVCEWMMRVWREIFLRFILTDVYLLMLWPLCTNLSWFWFFPVLTGNRTSRPRPSAWATWRGSSTSSSGAWVWQCWWPSSNSATSHATRPKEWRWRPSPRPKPHPNTPIPTTAAAPAALAAPAIVPSLARTPGAAAASAT